MQNGKHAVARHLIDGIGFGSTEFHVLRPSPSITSNWLHYFVRQPEVLAAAATHFVGTAGQQRVPDSFLRGLRLPLASVREQRRITAIVDEQMAAVERARAAAEAQLEAAKALPAAYLRSVFESDEAKGWSMRRLGEILELRKDVVHPYENPSGPATFVGLEHIEPGTGIRTGSLDVEMSELAGRKPRFYQGDIVYGYLRPYLNKVWIADFDGLCSVDQYVYSVTPEADARFVAWFMRSPVYLERAPTDSGPGQLPRIRTEEVAAVQIGFPPLPAQKQIAERVAEAFREFNGMHASIREQRRAIDTLPASLLREAFSGAI